MVGWWMGVGCGRGAIELKPTLHRFGMVSCREVVTRSRQTDISSARLGEGKNFDGNRVC